MNRLFKLMLEHRGWTYQSLAEMDNPEHGELKDIDIFCERLHKARVSGEKIVILPDFDMDGIMSGVIGYAGLSELGFNVELYVPNSQDGYGFDEDVVDKLISRHPGVDIILTCDNGITCIDGARHAVMRGLTVLVTDHHSENLNETVRGIAEVVVDPCRVDDDYELEGICGAHVLWQVLDYYARHYVDARAVDQISRLRVFAGIGTISDIMPMLNENRELVRDSVHLCRMCYSGGSWLGFDNSWFVDSLEGTGPYLAAFRGLHQALLAFRDNNTLHSIDDIDEQFFGFTFAPTFNSVKRMDGNMADAFGVFTTCTTPDEYNNTKVQNYMKVLIDLNERRKVLVLEAFTNMIEAANPYAPLIYVVDASSGVLGLLASKITKSTGGPCIVIRRSDDGSYSGSGRAPIWYPFISRVRRAGFSCAGHEGAFGVRIKNDAELHALYEFLAKDIQDLLGTLQFEAPTYDFEIGEHGDTGVDIPLFIEFVETCDRFAPYGKSFERPNIKYTFPLSSCVLDTIGKQNQHLRFKCERGMKVLCWNQAYVYDQIKDRDMIEVVGSLDINEFNGNRSIQFVGEVVV